MGGECELLDWGIWVDAGVMEFTVLDKVGGVYCRRT